VVFWVLIESLAEKRVAMLFLGASVTSANASSILGLSFHGDRRFRFEHQEARDLDGAFFMASREALTAR
jgi:hypothetical protein